MKTAPEVAAGVPKPRVTVAVSFCPLATVPVTPLEVTMFPLVTPNVAWVTAPVPVAICRGDAEVLSYALSVNVFPAHCVVERKSTLDKEIVLK